ncbi:MAG: type 4a pilus biogenesis protein PilO [Holophagaceae bacterium]|nr:type 4a pilus biogenesis protein PilO [Holophagaceae bacterium]
MNPQLTKQIGIGAAIGIVLAALTYFLLNGKRDDLKATLASIESLQKEVDKGNGLKANYEKLKVEVANQEKRIEELIKIMPTEQDRAEMTIRMKKLADTAGIDQTSFSLETPANKNYYKEYPVRFNFRVGYHSFGAFASMISGYEKIINLSELSFRRVDNQKGAVFPAVVNCRISAFVYNPAPPAEGAPAAARPAAARAKAGKEE